MCKDSTLLKKLDRRAELKRQIDQLQYELDEVETFVKNEMDKREVTKLEIGPYTVRYTQATRSTFNAKGLKAVNESLYNQFIGFTSYRTFTVKTPEGK